jgi:hypothetical protein
MLYYITNQWNVSSPMTSKRTADTSLIFSHLMVLSIDPVNTLSVAELSCGRLKKRRKAT